MSLGFKRLTHRNYGILEKISQYQNTYKIWTHRLILSLIRRRVC